MYSIEACNHHCAWQVALLRMPGVLGWSPVRVAVHCIPGSLPSPVLPTSIVSSLLT